MLQPTYVTPDGERRLRRGTMIESFLARVVPDDNDCWIWQGSKDRDGYGRSGTGAVIEYYAHRLAWRLMRGPIPDGLQIDHLCYVRACVNPAHLRVVTMEFNVRNQRRRRAAITSCNKGHVFDSANTYFTPKGTRQCRACNRASVAAYAARQREALAGASP